MLNDQIKFLKTITNVDAVITYDYLLEGENYIESYYNNEEYKKSSKVLKRTDYEFVLLKVKQDLLKFMKLEQKQLLFNYILLNIYYLCNRLKELIISNEKNNEFEEIIPLLNNLYKVADNCIKILHNELITNKNVKISDIYLYFFALTEITNNINLYTKQQLQINEICNTNFKIFFDSNIDIKENSENLDQVKTLIKNLNNKGKNYIKK